MNSDKIIAALETEVSNATVLFRVIAPTGDHYQVHTDGHISGFPADSIIINYYPHRWREEVFQS